MSKNRYETEILELSKTGLLLSLTIVTSLITSTWSPFPKVPFFNARPDFWFGMAFLSLLFLNRKYSILFVIALPFALIPSELSDSYVGFGDYMLELGAPMIVMFLMAFKPKGEGNLILWSSLVFGLYFSARLLAMSYAGVYYWEVPWRESLVYNVWNVLLDGLVSLPIFYLGFFKLLKTNNT